jgi:hypothetical protein
MLFEKSKDVVYWLRDSLTRRIFFKAAKHFDSVPSPNANKQRGRKNYPHFHTILRKKYLFVFRLYGWAAGSWLPVSFST